MKTVLLKGTHQAVEEARAELAQMAYDEMAKKLKKMRLTEFDRSVNGENYLKKSNFVYSSDEGENLRKVEGALLAKCIK
jgi:predicted solute-binding protein